MVTESQGKIRKSQGILHSKVSEKWYDQGKSKYQGAKVNKDAEKSLNCFMQTASKKISARFACGLFVSLLLN